MREILFRGKRVDNGEWVEGNYIHRTKYYGDSDDAHFILTGGEFDCDYYDAFKVDPSTVGQYTGLTDKNGKKIFEGDIVMVGGKHIDCVLWSNGCFCMANQIMFYEFTYQSPYEIEVIGNIHDNAELIGGEKQ